MLQDQALREELDPGGKTRELSIFQLGFRLIQRCLATAINRLPTLKLHLTSLRLKPILLRGQICQ